MSTLTRRIAASTGANLYAQASTIAIQLLSLPLYLSHWGLETYGQWLVLSAIPAYFAMADVGMVTAAGNRMTMLVGDDNLVKARQVFQSAIAFMSIVCMSIMLLSWLVITVLPEKYLPAGNVKLALAALITGVVAGLFGGLPEAVYRSTHRYALGTFVSNSVRLLEWAGGLIGLSIGGGFVDVAVGMLVPRVLSTVGMILHARWVAPEFAWGWSEAKRSELRSVAGPAVAFMAFPIGNAIAFQGVTLVVAAALGPAAVAVFNTYRTMARVTVQATGTFGHSLWPEFSRLFGQGNSALLALLYRRSYLFGIATSVLASAVVYVLAPYVLSVWSKGKIAFLPELMLAAMAYATVAGCWHVCRVLMLATNRHANLAWQYLVVSTMTLPAAWWLAKSEGLVGAMGAMFVAEVAMLAVCTTASYKLLATPVVLAGHGT